MPTLTEVRSLAMKLPKSSRMRLASELFESSTEPTSAWSAGDILAEAVRRDQEIESGAVAAVPLDEFMAETRDRRLKLAKA